MLLAKLLTELHFGIMRTCTSYPFVPSSEPHGVTSTAICLTGAESAPRSVKGPSHSHTKVNKAENNYTHSQQPACTASATAGVSCAP
jgi:hypothetical protein